MSNQDPNFTIELEAVYVKGGINIGGYALRNYSTGAMWSIHLHQNGGIVRIYSKAEQRPYYVPVSSVEACDGFAEEGPVSSSVSSSEQERPTLRAVPPMGELVANQARHHVEEAPVVAVNSAQDLGESDDAAKRAKSAHFRPVDPQDEAPKPAAQFGSLSVPKPAKRKPGRPRKVLQSTSVATSEA